jgi:hypothetical protein
MAKPDKLPELENTWFLALVNEDPRRRNGLAVYLVNATAEGARVTLHRSAFLDMPSGAFPVGDAARLHNDEDLGEVAPRTSVCLADGLSPSSDLCFCFWVTLHGTDGTPREIGFSAFPEDIYFEHCPPVEVPVLTRLAVAYLPHRH